MHTHLFIPKDYCFHHSRCFIQSCTHTLSLPKSRADSSMSNKCNVILALLPISNHLFSSCFNCISIQHILTMLFRSRYQLMVFCLPILSLLYVFNIGEHKHTSYNELISQFSFMCIYASMVDNQSGGH